MNIKNTLIAGVLLGGVALGGASMGGASVKSTPVTANQDNVTISLPNAGHGEKVGQTVVNLLSNDKGTIDKNKVTLVNPVTHKDSNNFKIGKTTYNFDKGVLRVSYSGVSSINDFKTLNYKITAKDGLSTSMAQVTFKVTQLADPIKAPTISSKSVATKTNPMAVKTVLQKTKEIPPRMR